MQSLQEVQYNLTEITRYLIPGLNFILILILFPALFFKTKLSDNNILVLLLFSLAVGFLLDCIKFYKYIPFYRKTHKTIKQNFKSELTEFKNIFALQKIDVDDLQDTLMLVASPEHSSKILWGLSRFVLLLNTAVIFFMGFILWFMFFIYFYIYRHNDYILIDIFTVKFWIVSFIISVIYLIFYRLFAIEGLKEIALTNKKILFLLHLYKYKIKELF